MQGHRNDKRLQDIGERLARTPWLTSTSPSSGNESSESSRRVEREVTLASDAALVRDPGDLARSEESSWLLDDEARGDLDSSLPTSSSDGQKSMAAVTQEGQAVKAVLAPGDSADTAEEQSDTDSELPLDHHERVVEKGTLVTEACHQEEAGSGGATCRPTARGGKAIAEDPEDPTPGDGMTATAVSVTGASSEASSNATDAQSAILMATRTTPPDDSTQDPLGESKAVPSDALITSIAHEDLVQLHAETMRASMNEIAGELAVTTATRQSSSPEWLNSRIAAAEAVRTKMPF